MAAAPLSSLTERALSRGIALYDAGQFWESHEAWEEAWIEEDGETRQLLQGLIQVAAGFFKATVHRQPHGCVKLLGSALEKLGPLGAACCGVELADFRNRVALARAQAERWARGEDPAFDVGLIPGIVRVAKG
jgi:predicted metal-dependent hydrolase